MLSNTCHYESSVNVALPFAGPHTVLAVARATSRQTLPTRKEDSSCHETASSCIREVTACESVFGFHPSHASFCLHRPLLPCAIFQGDLNVGHLTGIDAGLLHRRFQVFPELSYCRPFLHLQLLKNAILHSKLQLNASSVFGVALARIKIQSAGLERTLTSNLAAAEQTAFRFGCVACALSPGCDTS